MIFEVLGTTYGDSNLDGVFNSTDLVRIFQAGEYEDQIEDNSHWATGDWNCDREFDSSDLIRAFQAGGYAANVVAVHDAAISALTATLSEKYGGEYAKRRKQPIVRLVNGLI
jgi:hypothetical protein